MNKFIIISVLLLSSGCAFASTNFSYQQNSPNTGFQPVYNTENYQLNNNTLKGRIVTVPAGQTFKAVFMAPLSSQTAYNGQKYNPLQSVQTFIITEILLHHPEAL